MGEVIRALVNASYTAHAIATLWQLIFSFASVHVAVFVAVSSVAVVSITAAVFLIGCLQGHVLNVSISIFLVCDLS